MAIDKQELIFKKVFAGKASTDNNKQYFEEGFDGRLSVFSPDVWSEAGSIPDTPTINTTDMAQNETRSEGVITYVASASMAYVQGTGVDGTAFSSSIQDWIPFNYGDGTSYTYVLRKSNGDRIFPGDTSNWTFDTETGVLIFHDTLPSGVTTSLPPTMTGYYYTGKKLNTGLVTGEITASGAISASGHLFASLSLDTSAGTNGVVMYDEATGQLYYTGSYGAGGAVDLTDLYDWTSSIDISITSINAFTESVDASITSINSFTESVNISITSINSFTESVDASITSINAFTESTDISITAINLFTGSANTSINALNIFTGSANTSINALNIFTGSITGTANEIIVTPDGNGLTIGLPDDVIIQNKLTILGDLVAENYIVSSSTMYMTTSFFDGDTIFGDTMDDTHQFTGSVFVTGSTFFGADQTTTHHMTGSLYVSGALYFDFIDGGTF